MHLEIDVHERTLLQEMLDSRLQELQPEIRRCQNYRYQQELKDESQCLRKLRERIQKMECDATA